MRLIERKETTHTRVIYELDTLHKEKERSVRTREERFIKTFYSRVAAQLAARPIQYKVTKLIEKNPGAHDIYKPRVLFF